MIIIIKKEVQINQMPVLQNMLIKKAWSPGPPPELRGVHGPALELQTKVPEDYSKVYKYREGTYLSEPSLEAPACSTC